MGFKFCLVLVYLVFVGFTESHEGHNHPLQTIDGGGVSIWSSAHHLSLKVNQGVDLKWISKDDHWLTMEMSSFTKGYVSVGFCPKWKGTMEGCDIVLGWVDNKNGSAYIYDYYARGNTLPELDVSQDYQLLDAKQERGMTTIRFRRKWNTGDEFYDADLENSNVRVIWAWHPEDAFSADSYFKHAGNSRGHGMQDVSLKNPGQSYNGGGTEEGHHYHEEYHSAAASSEIKAYFTTLWLLCLYGFVQ